MSTKQQISPETQQTALGVAKANQKPGQTKEQTKLIAQGIEKGIAEYKKQQKAKARERNKQQKKQQASCQLDEQFPQESEADLPHERIHLTSWLPWGLLLVSWLGFAWYVWL